MTMLPGIVGKSKFQTTGGFHFCVGSIQFPAAISNSGLSLFFFREELQSVTKIMGKRLKV